MLPRTGETIQQLAARKILQELKDGTGYLHAAASGGGVIGEWVKKEGVRVGLKYRVASQWTSFVAVVRSEEEREEEWDRAEDVSSNVLDDHETYEFIDGNGAHNGSAAREFS